MNNNYRLYSLTNYFLNSVAKGIQSFHAGAEISVKYATDSVQNVIYREWASKDKTIIVLNGGNSKAILDYADFFNNMKHGYPWAMFAEDAESLNGAATACAIILPESVYLGKSAVYEDIQLYNSIKDRPLAL